MKIIKQIWLLILFVANCLSAQPEFHLDVVSLDNSKLLRNELCTASNVGGGTQIVFRPHAADERPEAIVLHYTAGFAVDHAIETFYKKGTSCHFIVDENGTIFVLVHPDNIAFHAGLSIFAGKQSLNKYSIGIEVVGPGYDERLGAGYDEAKEAFGSTTKIAGDDHDWFSFSELQFTAVARLTSALQGAFSIPGWLVLTHADVAIGRKFDIGPIYLYERAFTEFRAGYFYEHRDIDLTVFSHLQDCDYIAITKLFGYRFLPGKPENIHALIKAYQMYYSRENISGTLVPRTKADILSHTIDLYHYEDIYTSSTYSRFISSLDELMGSDDRFATLREAIGHLLIQVGNI